MAICFTCSKTIIFGGITENEFRFCDKHCRAEKSALLDSIATISAEAADEEALRIFNGRCTECGGKNCKVDYYKSVSAWSFIVVTRISEHVHVVCRNCARKAQLFNSFTTFLFGWWGIPIGIAATPLIICINVYQVIASSRIKSPSLKLRGYARERLAATINSPANDQSFLASWGRV